MSTVQRTYSPVDGSLVVERELADASQRNRVLDRAVSAQHGWSQVALSERIRGLTAMVDAFVSMKDDIAEEITRQMGRPLSQSPG